MTTLLLNGRVHSPAMPDASAMAVRDGVVAWLGSDDVGRAQFPDARIVDLEGAFVAPAFVDSHVHLTATGLTVDRTGSAAGHLATALPAAARRLRPHPSRGPIWGHGWDESGWPERTPPSTADVDGAVGDRPAYLARVDVHSAAASTALRRLAPGLADAHGFSAAQPLTGDAHHLVRSAARDGLTPDQRRHAQLAALDAAAAFGIVAVHECAGPNIGGLADWNEVRGIEHGVEVVGYWGEAVGSAAEARELIARTGARGLAGDLFVDGALGSRTAWLHQPYSDAADCCGNAYLDTDAIAAHLRACTEAQHHRRDSMSSATRPSAPWSTRSSASSRSSAHPRSPVADTASSTSKWSPGSRRTGSARGVCSPACSPISMLCGAANTACTPSASAPTEPDR